MGNSGLIWYSRDLIENIITAATQTIFYYQLSFKTCYCRTSDQAAYCTGSSRPSCGMAITDSPANQSADDSTADSTASSPGSYLG